MKAPWYVFWLVVLLAIPIDQAITTFKTRIVDELSNNKEQAEVLRARPMVIVGFPMSHAETALEETTCVEDLEEDFNAFEP